MTDFEGLLQALGNGEASFIMVGGAAAIAHGSARFTQALEIVYQRDPENLDRLVAALAPLGPYLRGVPADLPFLWEKSTLARGLNFTLVTSLGELDLLGEIPGGGSYEDLLPGALELHIFGHAVRCLSLPQLIRAKRAAGLPEDLEALAELEAIEGH